MTRKNLPTNKPSAIDKMIKKSDFLYFLPLGGSGEIGMNLNLYAYKGQWLMVDLGISFHDDIIPSIDVIMPDPSFIAERRNQLLGLVLTHAHEDHIGAIQYLWEHLGCPVYGTDFTLSVVKRKLKDWGIDKQVPLYSIPLDSSFDLGPFNIEMISLTHSIPEPSALAIHTPAGTVFHTGDWKFDEKPMLGKNTNISALKKVGQKGVLALVGDSTNAMVEGQSQSENDVMEALDPIISSCSKRVLVTCFASNVARLHTLAKLARKHGRKPFLLGRSLYSFDQSARDTGYFDKLPPFAPLREFFATPRHETFIISTGSQGEPRAALTRLANLTHPDVRLEPDDTVIFSSRIIPGNEKAILNTHNLLIKQGIKVIDDATEFTHVSGHPPRQDLMDMYQYIRPHIAIPVHGEMRHMAAHAELAKQCQVPHAVLIENGCLVELNPDHPTIVDHVATGRWALDGKKVRDLQDPVLSKRKRVIWNNVVFVSIVLNRLGELVAQPDISAPGLYDSHIDRAKLDYISESIVDYFDSQKKAKSEEKMMDDIQQIVRKYVQPDTGYKPVVETHILGVR